MSKCTEYLEEGTDNTEPKTFSELKKVTKFIILEVLKDFKEVALFGSRNNGGWRYYSDHDIAVGESNVGALIELQKKYCNEFGVRIDVRDILPFKHLKIPHMLITRENKELIEFKKEINV